MASMFAHGGRLFRALVVRVILRQGKGMTVCGREAVLLITTSPAGTATNVARSRTVLHCDLASGHTGPHRDSARNESWEQTGANCPTLLRHEDEER